MAEFVWFDHRSDNPSGVGTFYEKLLGWKRAEQSPPGTTWFGASRPWSGMAATEELPSGWLPYVRVDDVDVASQQAQTLGATVLKTRTTGPAGDFVVIQDPGGGAVALWQQA